MRRNCRRLQLDLPECWAGECLPSEAEIRERLNYVKSITGKSEGKVFHVVEARDGFHAFVELNGRYYATGGYPSIEDLEGYIF